MTQPSQPSPTPARINGRIAPTQDTEFRPDQTGPSEFDGNEASADPQFAPPDEPGELGKLGRFRVLKQLGKGGMGAVYLGFDAGLQRKVALKVMLPQFAANSSARERFLREARAAAQIKSDHVVTIYEVGEERNIPFIAMEYLQGYPLDDFLREKGNIPIEHAIRIGRETALGLADAHTLGLIHRDIKPGNLWLEAPRGRIKILDFGLARQEADDIHLTQSGAVVGTPAYMSPEQARALKIDARSDLFSLGGVLYRLCTGQLPFQGTTTMALLMSLGVDEPTPIRQLNPEVPETLAKVIHRLLAKNPDQRFQTATEVAEALGNLNTYASGRPAPLIEPLAVSVQTQNVWAGIDDSEQDRTQAEPTAETDGHVLPTKTGRKRGLLIAGLVGLVALVAAVLAVVTIQTPTGTLVVETDDPDVEVVVKKDGAVIRDKTKDREIELKVGDYTIELAEKKEGLRLNTDRFEITKGGKSSVRVWLEKKPVAKEKVEPPLKQKDADRSAAEWVLSIGGAVRINDLDRDLKNIAELPKEHFALSRVELGGNSQVSDAGLAHFKDCKNLTSLNLGSTQVSDVGLARVKDCKNLTRLELGGSKVSDVGLAHFKDCKNLTHLGLGDPKVSDVGLAYFKDCKNLTYLDLHATKVSDAGLANFNQVSDVGLAYFKDCKNLTRLFLNSTQVSDVGLAYFKDCKNLTFLDLRSNNVRDVGLAYFKDCKNLTHLGLGDTKVSDVGLANFKDCQNLTHLVLGATNVSDVGLANFKDCQNLTQLVLGATNVSDVGLANFKDCQNLTQLVLGGTKVSDAGLAHVAKLKSLIHIDLKKTKVTAEGVKTLATALPKCKIEWDGGVIEPKK